MRKVLFILLTITMVFFFNNCAKKRVKVEPVKQQQAPVVEKVDEKAPVMQKPNLSEEELFSQKSIEQLNQEDILKRIYFDFDQFFIRNDMKPVLQANAEWLLKHRTAQLLIEGHCDERGTEEYNIALGEKRAEVAKNYLVSLGVAAANLKIIPYGKSRPLVKGIDEATWAKNRRAEFVIVAK